MKQYILKKEGYAVRYHELPGSAPTLVFLHGLGCASSFEYPAMLAQPALRGRGALLIDLLGAGYSDKPTEFGYTVEEHAAYLNEMLRALDLRDIVLFGHSLGGAVAICLAGLLGERLRMLILTESNLDPSPAGATSRKIGSQSSEAFLTHGYATLLAHAQKKNPLWVQPLHTGCRRPRGRSPAPRCAAVRPRGDSSFTTSTNPKRSSLARGRCPARMWMRSLRTVFASRSFPTRDIRWRWITRNRSRKRSQPSCRIAWRKHNMMQSYIALLRGINVGTNGRIRMDALRKLLEDAGFSRVSTYIQSGNVLLDSALSEQDAAEAIGRAMKDGANITTVAVLRSVADFAAIIEQCPFSAEEIAQAQAANQDGESFHVFLLPKEPSADALKKLADLPAQDDTYVLSGRTVYLLLRQSIRTSKLALKLQRAFPDATARNWNTMVQINGLARRQNGEAL